MSARACFTPQNLRTRKSINIIRTKRRNADAAGVIVARVAESKALGNALVGTTRVPATSSGNPLPERTMKRTMKLTMMT